MEISIKLFEQLSNTELYQILRLRSEVFVVEQDCVYQDLDNNDQKALHVLGVKEGNIIAYTRVFKPGDYFSNISIGRVVVQKEERKFGYGKIIMESSIMEMTNRFQAVPIEISAQTYLLQFYNNLGFVTFGEEYMEDGIPHIRMVRE
ncbi:MAG: GNAT family N-acetyltransferase [Flavobacteriaceae bacterium]